MDDARRPMAPVNQPVALVAQWRREVPRAKPLVANVVNAGTNQLWQCVWMNLCSRLKTEKHMEHRFISTGWSTTATCFSHVVKWRGWNKPSRDRTDAHSNRDSEMGKKEARWGQNTAQLCPVSILCPLLSLIRQDKKKRRDILCSLTETTPLFVYVEKCLGAKHDKEEKICFALWGFLCVLYPETTIKM